MRNDNCIEKENIIDNLNIVHGLLEVQAALFIQGPLEFHKLSARERLSQSAYLYELADILMEITNKIGRHLNKKEKLNVHKI